jgi:Chaperone of endosialidase
MRNNIRGFIIGGFIASGLGALAVNIPFTFNAGSPIKASDINANFGSLKTAVDALENSKPQTDDTLKGDGTNANKLGVKFPLNTSLSNSGIGLYVANTGAGEGIFGYSSQNVGVFGKTAGGNGSFAIKGEASGSGLTGGVYGKADGSALGTGVVGHGGVTGGFFEAKGDVASGLDPVGVYGSAYKNRGTGVVGNGSTWGGRFTGGIGLQVNGGTGITVSSKDGGSTLLLNQNGNGVLINGNMPNGNRFVVLNDGTVETSGNVIAKGVTLVSDRNAKTNFSSINSLEVLNKVVQLPVSRWNYKSDDSSLKHVGPMAQDFHAAFGLNGKDDTHVSAVDMQGVAFAAIQGLNQKLETENATLRASLAALEARLSKLEQK